MLVPAGTLVFRARRDGLLIIPFQATQTVTADQTLNFRTFSAPDAPPVFLVAAAAEPSIVTGVSSWLSAFANDDRDTDRLTYTWRVVSGPAGADVSFNRNGNNSAQRALATFDRPGVYQIEAAAADTAGGTSTSVVTVTVVPVPVTCATHWSYVDVPALIWL